MVVVDCKIRITALMRYKNIANYDELAERLNSVRDVRYKQKTSGGSLSKLINRNVLSVRFVREIAQVFDMTYNDMLDYLLSRKIFEKKSKKTLDKQN